MPLAVHLGLWREAPYRLLRQSRYAALLVSMHGSRLYERRDLSRLPTGDARQVREFLDEHRRLQQALVDSLAADPDTRAAVSPERLEHNRQLIWTWDSLSLAICLDWAPFSLKRIPAADGSIEITLSPGPRPAELALDPWPFAPNTLTVRCEGQRLVGPAETDGELERLLADAPWETLEFTLLPGDR